MTLEEILEHKTVGIVPMSVEEALSLREERVNYLHWGMQMMRGQVLRELKARSTPPDIIKVVMRTWGDWGIPVDGMGDFKTRLEPLDAAAIARLRNEKRTFSPSELQSIARPIFEVIA